MNISDLTISKAVDFLEAAIENPIDVDYDDYQNVDYEFEIAGGIVIISYMACGPVHTELFNIHIGNTLVDGSDEEDFVDFDVNDFDHEQQARLDKVFFNLPEETQSDADQFEGDKATY